MKLNSKSHRPGLHVSAASAVNISRLPLVRSWRAAISHCNNGLLGFYLMAASKKGVSAHQLMRTLGIGSYRTAWFMAHRIREAMIEEQATQGRWAAPAKS